MKHIFRKVPPIFKSFYFLTAAFFVVWMLFFDSNDIVTQMTLSQKKAELESSKSYYMDRIKEVEEDREALLNNPELLEKIAREKYFMKEKGEEVFTVVEE